LKQNVDRSIQMNNETANSYQANLLCSGSKHVLSKDMYLFMYYDSKIGMEIIITDTDEAIP
jgi:hypothetical protein